MKNPNATLRGIVVAGNSLEEVENSYRAVATGQSVRVLKNEEENFLFLSSADNDLQIINPSSGEIDDLVEATGDYENRLEFFASGSEDKVRTNYTLCSDGCGAHLIADDPKLMDYCPVCATELKDLSEEDIEQFLHEEEAMSNTGEQDTQKEAVAIVTASTRDDAVDIFRSLAQGGTECKFYDCESSSVVTSSDTEISYSPFTGESSTEIEGASVEFQATASDGDGYDANWYICANSECGQHVISSDESPVFCPSCSSGLIEPGLASAIATGEDKDTTIENYKAVASSDDFTSYQAEDDSYFVTLSSTAFSYDPVSGVEIEPVESFVGHVESSDEPSVYKCSNDDCGIYVATASCVGYCPNCDSEIHEEDLAVESSSESSSEEEEEEPYEEENEEDTSYSSDKYKDDEDDEDDDEEEEDDDEYDEDDDEDYEDMDDKNSMSVSSDDDDDSVVVNSVRLSDEPEESGLTTVQTDMLSMASAKGDLSGSDLDIVNLGNVENENTWMAMHKGTPIAKVTASSSKVESGVYHSAQFANVVHASVNENGVEKAFEELGFQPIVAEVDVDSYVQNEVENQVSARVEDVRSNFEVSSQDYSERFEAALATAAEGINKGFFKDLNNPVKSALVSTLQSVGVKNSGNMVAQAHNQNNADYIRNLIAKAKEIMEYDVNVQNQLTEAVSSASAPDTATASSSQGPVIGHPANSPKSEGDESSVKEASASAESRSVGSNKGSYDVDSVLKTLGRRNKR